MVKYHEEQKDDSDKNWGNGDMQLDAEVEGGENISMGRNLGR